MSLWSIVTSDFVVPGGILNLTVGLPVVLGICDLLATSGLISHGFNGDVIFSKMNKTKFRTCNNVSQISSEIVHLSEQGRLWCGAFLKREVK